MWDSLIIAVIIGGAQGLVMWGALRVEMRWMRRDVDTNTAHLDRVEQHLTSIDSRCIVAAHDDWRERERQR